jgi:hypothetical protein
VLSITIVIDAPNRSVIYNCKFMIVNFYSTGHSIGSEKVKKKARSISASNAVTVVNYVRNGTTHLYAIRNKLINCRYKKVKRTYLMKFFCN